MKVTPEILRQLLRYEPETGKLFWLERGPKWFSDKPVGQQHNANAWNAKYAGKEAFTSVGFNGYRQGSVFRQGMNLHRVAWAIHHGEWPDHIDHINRDRLDNRICNLRSVTKAENAKNLSPRRSKEEIYRSGGRAKS